MRDLSVTSLKCFQSWRWVRMSSAVLVHTNGSQRSFQPVMKRRMVSVRSGTFTSVPDLTAVIRRFITGWNDRCEPFVWTKTADEGPPSHQD